MCIGFDGIAGACRPAYHQALHVSKHCLCVCVVVCVCMCVFLCVSSQVNVAMPEAWLEPWQTVGDDPLTFLTAAKRLGVQVSDAPVHTQTHSAYARTYHQTPYMAYSS